MNDASRPSPYGQSVQNAWVGGDLTLIQRVQGDVFVHHHHPPVPVEWPVRVGAVPKLASAFQPRDEVRGKIDAARQSGTAVVLTHVLSGGGGVGKSQLAAYYARQAISSGTDLVIWVSAAPIDSVVAAYAEAAVRIQAPGVDRLNPESDARALLDWLSTTKRSWLVVLDDIADPFALGPWWPDSHTGTGWVLGTTRRRDAVISGSGRKVIEIDVYTPVESAAYLAERLGGSNAIHLLDDAATDLAVALGHLPLALAHAAAFMIDQQIRCGKYLELFTARRSRLNELMPLDADTEGYGRQVAITLRLALDAAQGRHPKGLAVPAMRLIALLDPAGHPDTVWALPRTTGYLRSRRANGFRGLLRLQAGIARRVSPDEARAAILLLHRFGLVTYDARSSYRNIRIHGLTARAVRETMSEAEISRLTRLAAAVVLASWPRSDHSNWDLAAVLRANASSLVANSTGSLRYRRVRAASYRAGNSMLDAGMYAAAADYWKFTADAAVMLLGVKHRDALTARANLAASLERSGLVRQAIALKEQIATDAVRIFGAWHPDSLAALATLASSYGQAGRVDEAVSLLERVIAESRYVEGVSYSDIQRVRSDLAVIYSISGRYSEAIPILEDVLAERVRTLGSDHPDILTTQGNLATVYFEAGRADEAALLLEKVAEGFVATLGADHPVTIKARAGHAAIPAAVDRERSVQQISVLGSLTAVAIEALGSDHPDALQIQGNLAGHYAEAGRLDEAISILESVSARFSHVLGDQHLHTLQARISLAAAYAHAGRTTAATELSEHVSSDAAQTLGYKHPTTLIARAGLASSYREAGDFLEAIRIGEQVYADSAQALGAHHQDTLHSQSQLASSYLRAGRIDAAIASTESVAEALRRFLGANHPQTLEALGNLAVCYSEAGRGDEAISLEKRTVEALTRVVGADHPATVNARMNLGAICSRAGRLAEAIDLEEASAAACARILGAEHPTTLVAHANLATTYWRAGRPAEAITLVDLVTADYVRILGPEHPDTIAAVKTRDGWRSR